MPIIKTMEATMKKRFKMSKNHSRKSFTKNAKRIHKRNAMNLSPMRGGIRL